MMGGLKRLVLMLFVLGSLPLLVHCASEKKDGRPFCRTVDEAANWLLAQASEEETLWIARCHEAGLIHMHFGFGMWIRNNVPVWGNETLIKSAGERVHPDDISGMILHEYWLLARARLPKPERARIEYFEGMLPRLEGSKPEGGTHRDILRELNAQIQAGWPKNAPYPPYTLVADEETYFTWLPEEMGESLNENVLWFVQYHRAMPFYDGDTLRVGDPERTAEPADSGKKPS